VENGEKLKDIEVLVLISKSEIRRAWSDKASLGKLSSQAPRVHPRWLL